MNESLRVALARARPILEAGLAEAERDLEACRNECSRLEASIRRLRALLNAAGVEAPTPVRGKRYLHEAMWDVLTSLPRRTMRAPFLATEINRRRLYLNRDGTPVTLYQVHSRVHRYPHLFERTTAGIKARL